MPWFKVDDNLGFHHKVIAAGNPAMGLWVRAGSICAQQLTDGFVPDHMVLALGTKAQAEKLVTVDLWDRVEGGYRFHGWGERQPSKAHVEAERAAAADRMREYRAKRKGTAPKASPQVEGLGTENVQPNERRTNAEVQESFGNPDPTQSLSRPDPIEEASSEDAAPPGTTLALVRDDRPDVERICESLADHIEARGSKRPTITARWRNEARLLLDNDKRSEEQVHAAMRWLFTSSHRDAQFWRTNIRSMPKLRAEYDRLRELADTRPAVGGSRNQEFQAQQETAMARAIEKERQMGIRP